MSVEYRQIISYQQSMKKLTGQDMSFSEAQARITAADRGEAFDPPAGIDPAKLARMARDYQDRQRQAGVTVNTEDAVQAILRDRGSSR